MMFVRIHEPFILSGSAGFRDLIIVDLRRKAFLSQFTSKFSLHYFQGKQNILGNCTLPTFLYIFHFVISSAYKLLLNQSVFCTIRYQRSNGNPIS